MQPIETYPTGPTGFTGPALFGPTGATAPSGPTGASYRGIQYLYNRVRIEAIGASEATIRTMLYDTLLEFFGDSSVWQELLVGNLIGGVVEYYLVPQEEPGGVIIRLDGVYDTNGFSVPAAMRDPPYMRLAYLPNLPNPVLARVIKNVAIPHDFELPQIPYWVVDRYGPYLLAGVMSHLQIQADRPYSDPKLAVVNHGRFREGVNYARVNALRQNTFGKNTWVYPQQFRTTSQQGGVSVGNAFNEF